MMSMRWMPRVNRIGGMFRMFGANLVPANAITLDDGTPILTDDGQFIVAG